MRALSRKTGPPRKPVFTARLLEARGAILHRYKRLIEKLISNSESLFLLIFDINRLRLVNFFLYLIMQSPSFEIRMLNERQASFSPRRAMSRLPTCSSRFAVSSPRANLPAIYLQIIIDLFSRARRERKQRAVKSATVNAPTRLPFRETKRYLNKGR
ncbi:hypothetical protein PUN28_013054 [Cardiocondyla obscurior]|uniref:Uncharacterized protein n=1 Tax=Cardiocondyla obscurior TaxID=286306 RepID=A0AAW2F6D9_9HYME